MFPARGAGNAGARCCCVGAGVLSELPLCLTTLHLAPSLLALTPVFLQHQSSAACTSLMGNDEQDGKAGRGDALGRGQACPGQ